MISAEAARFLWDVKGAADNIVEFVAGCGLDDYLTDKMMRAAVERQFEIIGEALAGLQRRFPDTAAMIPELARIVAFRNLLIHAYASVDDGLVWQIVETHLPALRARAEELLRTAPPPASEGEAL